MVCRCPARAGGGPTTPGRRRRVGRGAEGDRHRGPNEAAGIHYSQLRYTDGRFDLTKLSSLSGPIGVVNGQLTSAVAQFRALQSGWLVQPVQTRLASLDTKVVRAQNDASLAAQLVQAAPSLLGEDGVRHYFVAFMTPAESRGLDGLIASYGELTADQGRLTLTRSGDISELNNVLAAAGGGHLSGPPGYLTRYGNFKPQDRMQDLSYAPDLPTVADVVRQLYPQAGGGSINGVLAIDPYGLQGLIGLTGPIEVPGLGQLTSANAASELIEGQYANFMTTQQSQVHDYLQDALRIEFHDLTTGSLPGPRALSEALDPQVRRGQLQVLELRKGGPAGPPPPRIGRYLPDTTGPRCPGSDHPERGQQQDRPLLAAFISTSASYGRQQTLRRQRLSAVESNCR